jgi:hypothetical protein
MINFTKACLLVTSLFISSNAFAAETKEELFPVYADISGIVACGNSAEEWDKEMGDTPERIFVAIDVEKDIYVHNKYIYIRRMLHIYI